MPQNAYAAFPELTVVELRTIRSSLEGLAGSQRPSVRQISMSDIGFVENSFGWHILVIGGMPKSWPHEPEERRTR